MKATIRVKVFQKSNYFLFFILIFLGVCHSQEKEKIHISGKLHGSTQVFNEEAPFWIHTNTNGFISEQSNYGLSAFAKADYKLSKSQSLQLGAGAFIRDEVVDNLQRSQLYIEYENSIFTITAGSKSPDLSQNGLSTINGNILLTGNTRPLPGALLKTTESFPLNKWLSFDAQLAHYSLNDERSTSGANVHFKSLDFNIKLDSVSKFSFGLKHYAQWAGTTPDGVKLPSDARAFTEVFFGSASSEFVNFNETINALGNHIGSYALSYDRFFKNGNKLKVYHQSIFEDRSGRELNNFPDGVWGIHFNLNAHKWLQGVLYEYVQTVSQSGSPRATNTPLGQQSGGDNYFLNGIYRSGWTYEGSTIGLPFINPIDSEENPENNRLFAHHIGLLAKIKRFDFTGKITYLQNLGTFRRPFDTRQHLVLTYLNTSYDLNDYGKIIATIGGDFIRDNSNNVGGSVGYSYFF